MASYNLNDILGGPNLTGLVNEAASGLTDWLGPEWRPTNPSSKVLGDTGDYTITVGQRGVATLGAYGAASKSAQMIVIGKRQVKLIHTIENITLPVLVYQNLLQYNELKFQEMGKQEVTRQVTEFKKRFSNLRIAAPIQALFSGKVNFDGNGNLLAAGASVPTNGTSVSMMVPDGTTAVPSLPGTTFNGTNIGTAIDVLASGTATMGRDTGGAGAGTWANPSTNIPQQIKNTIIAVERLCGMKIEMALYGSNINTYAAYNTALNSFLVRNSGANDQFVRLNEVPSPFLGVTWKDMSMAYFQDQNGVSQPLVGANQVVLCPKPSAEWLGWLEGSYMIPKDVGTLWDPNNPNAQFDTVYGMFAYGQNQSDPVTAKIVAGDTFLPVFTNPYPLVIATVA